MGAGTEISCSNVYQTLDRGVVGGGGSLISAPRYWSAWPLEVGFNLLSLTITDK